MEGNWKEWECLWMVTGLFLVGSVGSEKDKDKDMKRQSANKPKPLWIKRPCRVENI